MENNFDTITAIITPIAYSAVGIIRISGSESFSIAQSIFDRKIKPKMINYGHIINDNKEILDEVILLAFAAPNSYTTEDVVEIQTHGSVAILNSVLELILNKGARLAQKGEFTKRAFLNHRIDMTQAEAVLDIIHSKSELSAKNALNNLSGFLKNKIEFLKKDLSQIYSKIIAAIDFPEDVKEADKKEVVSICNDKILEINKILEDSKSHDFIKDGISACLIGKPNVGKSSLFNCLLNYNRAIVTPIEGTTRDTIKESINLNGYIINFIDTAGIRDKNQADEVEKIGIDNSIEAIKESNIVLFLYENDISEIDSNLIDMAQSKKYLFIKTKCDINESKAVKNSIEISAKTGFNIELLKNSISDIIQNIIPTQTNYTTTKRQQVCLIKAKTSLENLLNTAKYNDDEDLFAIDLKEALLALDEITGEVLTDNILNNIFDNFCIGK